MNILQALPQVFHLAANYNLDEHRIVGTSALSAIDSYNRHRTRLQPTTVKGTSRSRCVCQAIKFSLFWVEYESFTRANSVEEAVRRGQRHVEQAKLKLGMQMDDKAFQASLLESQVMVTKDHSKWNFDALQELLEGPLLNPKRMEEAIKVSRYVRRLISFYHPFSHRFCDLPRSKVCHIFFHRIFLAYSML